MSITSYSPADTNARQTGAAFKRSTTKAGSKAGSVLVSQPQPRSNGCGGNYACGLTEVSDDDLITTAQHGDQQAFAELCRRHSSMTKMKIFRIVQNHEDAEDAFQDTVLRAYTHLASFRRSCKFSTWIIGIGVNCALMMIRKRKDRRETHAIVGISDHGTFELQDQADPSLGPEGIYLKQQADLLVRRAVEKLQPNLRSAVDHYYGSELSLRESAKALDISVNAMKSRLLRGRVRLRSSLTRYEISTSGKRIDSSPRAQCGPMKNA